MAVLATRLGCALVAGALAMVGPARAASLEYVVKANFLLKFVPFVRWPAGALAPGAPFILCIAADDPFGGTLQSLAAGRRIDDHPLVVRKGTTGCNMIFAQAAPGLTEQLLAGSEGQPVLTVTDNDNGGIIRFRLQNGRVRFEVDAARAARAQLEISSRLLEAALAVRREDSR